MAATIHPTLELHLSLEKDHYEGDIESETERRFSELAPTEVERARASSQREDVLEFSVGEDAAGDVCDPVWHDAFTGWLAETFEQATGLIERENEARRNVGRPELSVARIEVRFGGGPAISLALEEGAIPPEAAGFVERARELLAARAFGEDVSCVSIPGCAVGGASAPERAAAVGDDTAAAPHAAGAPLGGVGFAADERKRDEPTQDEIDAALQEAEEALRGGGDAGGACTPDARIWEVDYTDGTHLRYDSVLAEVIPVR